MDEGNGIRGMLIELASILLKRSIHGVWQVRPMVGFNNVLKIAARVESVTYKGFYESARAHTNFTKPPEPLLIG